MCFFASSRWYKSYSNNTRLFSYDLSLRFVFHVCVPDFISRASTLLLDFFFFSPLGCRAEWWRWHFTSVIIDLWTSVLFQIQTNWNKTRILLISHSFKIDMNGINIKHWRGVGWTHNAVIPVCRRGFRSDPWLKDTTPKMPFMPYIYLQHSLNTFLYTTEHVKKTFARI